MNKYDRWEITRYGEWSAALVHRCFWCTPLFWLAYWFVRRVTGRWRYRWIERDQDVER